MRGPPGCQELGEAHGGDVQPWREWSKNVWGPGRRFSDSNWGRLGVSVQIGA